MIKIAPSVLSADFSKLGEELAAIEKTGNEFIHLDVMDGVFVPNITFGAPIIKALRKNSKLIFDTHLMIINPDKYVEDFAKAGSDYITVHFESEGDTTKTLEHIRSLGVKSGLTIKPKTQVSEIEHLLPLADMVLVMSVEPGFGGQSFIPESLDKIAALDKLRKDNGYNYIIEVDGGITTETILPCAKAGLDVAVAGSSVFCKPDYEKALRELEAAASL